MTGRFLGVSTVVALVGCVAPVSAEAVIAGRTVKPSAEATGEPVYFQSPLVKIAAATVR